MAAGISRRVREAHAARWRRDFKLLSKSANCFAGTFDAGEAAFGGSRSPRVRRGRAAGFKRAKDTGVLYETITRVPKIHKAIACLHTS